MGLPRSTYYDVAPREAGDAEIVATITAICDEFEAYGYRRVGAELRHRGIVVNSKKIRRLMREHDLQPKRRKRFVATTDSDHDGPIFPDLARDRMVDGPNQLWVADITYIAIATGLVYMAAILDAWSRRVVGYAISRSIDARLVVAALKAAIRTRQPPRGCIHHSDRGSQYASEAYRNLLADHGLVGSMDRRGLQHPQAALCARLSERRAIRGSQRPADGQNRCVTLSTVRGAHIIRTVVRPGPPRERRPLRGDFRNAANPGQACPHAPAHTDFRKWLHSLLGGPPICFEKFSAVSDCVTPID
jgi:putative transposase